MLLCCRWPTCSARLCFLLQCFGWSVVNECVNGAVPAQAEKEEAKTAQKVYAGVIGDVLVLLHQVQSGADWSNVVGPRNVGLFLLFLF